MRRSRLPAAVLLLSAPLLLLGGCQASGDRAVPATGNAPAAAVPVTQALIQGTASYPQRVKMPPGASLEVQLVGMDSTPQAVVAEATMRDIGGPPIAFELRYDPANLDPNGQYGLRARLLGTPGEVWFVSDQLTPVIPGHGVPVELQLERVTPAAAGDDARTASNVTHWQCGDLRVASNIDARGGPATLHVSGRRLQLPMATTAPTGHYADDRGNGFLIQGRAATLALSGGEARECTQTAQASPWYDAAARGIAFRAVGSEPGWFVEVGAGDAPTLRATLDYGERTIEALNMQVRLESGPSEFRGTASDGSKVVLSVRREACADGMSGERFEARASLHVGDHRYEGCGAFLSE